MLKYNKFQTLIFYFNCFILFLVVGFCSAILADIHQSFQLSYQSDNTSKFSSLMSLNIPYTVPENLLK